MTTLYSEQTITSVETLSHLQEGRHTILCGPTGCGKTAMAADIARSFGSVLFVAHRREIIAQADSEMPSNVICMTVQEALNYGPRCVDLLIIDEAHRAAAPTYVSLTRKYKRAIRLGLTATPRRIDGQGLNHLFDQIVLHGTMRDLIGRGRLVPYRALEPPTEAIKAINKLAHAKKRGGDYAIKEAAEIMNTPRLVSDAMREYKKH